MSDMIPIIVLGIFGGMGILGYGYSMYNASEKDEQANKYGSVGGGRKSRRGKSRIGTRRRR